MSNLDVYCVSYFEDMSLFAPMDDLGLILDKEDFITNKYVVDEESNLRSGTKTTSRKGKVVVGAS